jgi:hypothetical protein
MPETPQDQGCKQKRRENVDIFHALTRVYVTFICIAFFSIRSQASARKQLRVLSQTHRLLGKAHLQEFSLLVSAALLHALLHCIGRTHEGALSSTRLL